MDGETVPRMTWLRLPAERRRKLAVLIGRLARRQLETVAETTEDSHDRSDLAACGQDRQPSP